MNVGGRQYRTIWPADDGRAVEVIDQTRLPHEFAVARIASGAEAASAIRDMVVRGAPLIGATAAYGLALIERMHGERGTGPVNVMTHCNAGWLTTVDWGTALAPVFMAHDAGIPVHVWVSETRPRNQGAGLTAWELAKHGVPHTVVADSASGYLMQRHMVDCCITGTDRTAANGDVCNKVGTYLKALAARDNSVPFYVALPGPTIDRSMACGADIPIEERDPREVTEIRGLTRDGSVTSVTVTPAGTRAANPAFDVTPATLVTGLITERGLCPASREGLARLYPEHTQSSRIGDVR